MPLEATRPTVFVSYKRSSEDILQWVKRLVTDLIEVYGIQCLLDQYDLLPGDSIYEYMQRIKTEATHVLFVITPAAIASIEQNTGGLSFEAQLWTALRSQRKVKVIPLLREGDQTASYVEAHLYVDFRTETSYAAKVNDLAKVILGQTERPILNVRSLEQYQSLSIKEKITFIERMERAEESSRVILRQALFDPCKGVVGSALRRARSADWKDAVLADFRPPGMVWIPPASINTSYGETHVEGFFIDRYPVTNGEFAEFVDATRRMPPHYWRGQTPAAALNDHPLVFASFFDASDYAEWVGKRLPNDFEWEKAASWDPTTHTQRLYPWGDEFDPIKCNNRETGSGDTMPVGSFSPAGDSFYGVAEMYGNIREWTATPFTQTSGTDPNTPVRERNARVVRGRSWNRLSTWGRVSCVPTVGPMSNSFYRFRCALTL